jgi:hypothetical protein
MCKKNLYHNFLKNNEYYLNPQLSVNKLIKIKIKLILDFIYFKVTYLKLKELIKNSIQDIEGSKKNKKALILGSGYSAKYILNLIKLGHKLNEIDIFCTNYFPIYQNEIIPDYLLLSDENVFDLTNSRTEKLKAWLINNSSVKIICPAHLKDKKLLDQVNNQILYFNDGTSFGIGNNLNPMKPRSYMSLSVMKCMALTIFMGYKKIYFIGVDSNQFIGLGYNNANKIVQKNYSIYDSEYDGREITQTYPSGMTDYLYHFSLVFWQFEKFVNYQIYNLDEKSLLDNFKKAKIDEVLEIIDKEI